MNLVDGKLKKKHIHHADFLTYHYVATAVIKRIDRDAVGMIIRITGKTMAAVLTMEIDGNRRK